MVNAVSYRYQVDYANNKQAPLIISVILFAFSLYKIAAKDNN